MPFKLHNKSWSFSFLHYNGVMFVFLMERLVLYCKFRPSQIRKGRHNEKGSFFATASGQFKLESNDTVRKAPSLLQLQANKNKNKILRANQFKSGSNDTPSDTLTIQRCSYPTLLSLLPFFLLASKCGQRFLSSPFLFLLPLSLLLA